MLGKRPARIDPRTIKLSAVLRELPPLPPEYDLDQQLGIQDDRVFANDVYGDCVIAGRAHATLHFEKFEQGQLMDISDGEVISQYLKETDNEARGPGLVMLDSLSRWRREGWTAASRHYDIHAFAAINWKNPSEVMAAVYLLRGAYAGLFLPLSANDQFNRGDAWDIISGPEGAPNSWGGHCVYVVAYNATGPICLTWGKRQQMTWAFWLVYCEECYAVCDSTDAWLENSPVDSEALEKILAEIANAPLSPEPSAPPDKGCCKTGRSIVKAALRTRLVTFKRK